MSIELLDVVQQGKNSWWRYALSLMLIVFCWAVLGSLPWLALGIKMLPEATETSGGDRAQLLRYVLVNLSFCCFLVGIALAMITIHQRRLSTLINPTQVKLKRIMQGFSAWFGLTAVTYGLEALLAPTRFSLTFRPGLWLVFLPLALVLTPIQAATEELFFRGYLLQGLSLITRNRVSLIGISTGIFGWLHLGNPEIAASSHFLWLGLLYFAFGAFLALITLKDNGLELAIGQHAANNLFLVLVVRDQVSVLDTPAIVTRVVTPDARIEFFVFLLEATVFYALAFRGRN